MVGIVVFIIFSVEAFFQILRFFLIAQRTYAFFLPASYFLSACVQEKYVFGVLWLSCHVRPLPPDEKSFVNMDIVGFLSWLGWVFFPPIPYLENSLGYKTLELQECLLRGGNICLYTQVNST